jgi:hypothetical protein
LTASSIDGIGIPISADALGDVVASVEQAVINSERSRMIDADDRQSSL